MISDSLFPNEAKEALYKIGLIGRAKSSRRPNKRNREFSRKSPWFFKKNNQQDCVEGLFGKKIVFRIDTISDREPEEMIILKPESFFIDAQGELIEKEKNLTMESITVSCTINDVDISGFIDENKVDNYDPQKDSLDFFQVKLYTSLSYVLGMSVQCIFICNDMMLLACYNRDNNQEKTEDQEEPEEEDSVIFLPIVECRIID